MPLYEVEYSCVLKKEQKDALAKAIANVHHQHFGTPLYFVRIKFTNGLVNDNYEGAYITTANRIFATVRTGGRRTPKEFDALCADLYKAWQTVMDPKEALNGVFVLRSLEASIEEGFPLPPADGDEEWLKENGAAFQKRANDGDQGFKRLVAELKDGGIL